MSTYDLLTTTIPIPEAFDFLFQPSRYKGAYGGRGGGKSHSIAAALVSKASERPLRILGCREIQHSIRDSVKRLLDDKINQANLRPFYHSTDTEIRGQNGSLFIFAGLRTNPETIKSFEGVDIAWVEEANTVSQKSLDLLIPTVRKPGSELWFSWNPRYATDPVDVLFRGKNGPPPGSIIREISWRDNPWFPEVLKRDMEWDRKRDPDKYAHVWAGQYQRNSEARVFKNWRMGSDEEFQPKPNTRFYYGADWGFSTDPSTLVRCYIDGRTLYVDHEAYAVGCDIDLTPILFGGTQDPALLRLNLQAVESFINKWGGNVDLRALIADKNKKKEAQDAELVAITAKWMREFPGVPEATKWPSRADSARPETISYMKQHGFPRMVAAKKGAGSIEDGVTFLKGYDIVVHPRCTHTMDELTMYSWKVDELTGQILPILEDKKNHIIDPLRYALEDARLPQWRAV